MTWLFSFPGNDVPDLGSLTNLDSNCSMVEDDDSEFNGTPAISGDHLFIRSNKFLDCIGS